MIEKEKMRRKKRKKKRGKGRKTRKGSIVDNMRKTEKVNQEKVK